MSRDTVVAKRYAKALFEVAEQEQTIMETEQELRAFVEAVSGMLKSVNSLILLTLRKRSSFKFWLTVLKASFCLAN